MSASVVKFPSRASAPVTVEPGSDPASIIILPIVRIERNPDCPADAVTGKRQRRRRLPPALPGFTEKVLVNGQLHRVIAAVANRDGTITLNLAADDLA